MFNHHMDIKESHSELQQRRLELKQKLEQISLKQSQLDEIRKTTERELRGIELMIAGAETALGSADAHPQLPPRLTEHIRKVLAHSQVPLTPLQIRDSCEGVGIKAGSRKNLLIAVHTTLKRLGLRLKKVRVDGQVAYRPRTPYISDQWRRIIRSHSLRKF